MTRSILSVLRARQFLRRDMLATSYFNGRYPQIFRWLRETNEDTSFTYKLRPENRLYLCQCIRVGTRRPLAEIEGYVIAVDDNAELNARVAEKVAEFGRRRGCYAMVRALKPKVVVETGID